MESPGQQTITSPPTSSRPGPRPDKSRPCIGLRMHFCYSMWRGIQQSVLSKENLWDQPYLVFWVFFGGKAIITKSIDVASINELS